MRKTLGAGIAGLVIVGSSALGTGTAVAAEPLPTSSQAAADCSRALLPLLSGTQRRLCEAALGLTGSVGSTASTAVRQVPRAVTSAVPRVVPRAVPRVVERVGGAAGNTLSGVSGGSSSSSTRAQRPSSSTGGSGSSSAARRTPATAAATAPAPAAAVPIAPTQNYDTLMSSAYDRVPTGLLGTAPIGGAGASLIAPASFDPRLLLSGRPTRTLGPENGVTTASTADPTAYLRGDRIGTPMLLGVLTLSSVLALAVRAAVLRRSRRTALA